MEEKVVEDRLTEKINDDKKFIKFLKDNKKWDVWTDLSQKLLIPV